MDALVTTYKPQYAAIEEIFVYKNVKTAIKVGEARGVILLTLAKRHIPLFEFSPLQIKQALTGYGRATKIQMLRMAQRILHLPSLPTPDDAADALAAAISLIQSGYLPKVSL